MIEYKSEEEFLKNYNSSNYEKLSMTADILIVSVSSKETKNYRKTDKKMMSILLVKRDDYPYKDKWCLPGGFLNPKEETLEECARRVLKRETNLSDIYLEQLYTFDRVDRDPRMRVVSTSYVALIDKSKLSENVENASWFDIIKLDEKENIVNITLSNGDEIIEFSIEKKLREKTTDRYDFITKENNSIAFDHDLVISSSEENWLKELSNNIPGLRIKTYSPPGKEVGSSCGEFTKHYYHEEIESLEEKKEFENWKIKHLVYK